MYNIHAVREMEEITEEEKVKITKKLLDTVFEWWYNCIGEDEFISLQIRWLNNKHKYLITVRYKEYYTIQGKLKVQYGKAQFLY
jgi:hypothetical protein